MKLYEEWKRHFSRRGAIETAVKTLSRDHDLGLLTDRVCFECTNGVTEVVEMSEDDVNVRVVV